MDDIRHRIERLYAAVGATIDEELNKFPPTIAVTDREIFIRQDFTGGLTEAQIGNIGFTAIHLLAHLVDHLRGWAKRNGRSKAEVDRTVDNCSAISALIDLSNGDRHGAPTHDAGRTGKAPRIDNAARDEPLYGAGEGFGGPGSDHSIWPKCQWLRFGRSRCHRRDRRERQYAP